MSRSIVDRLQDIIESAELAARHAGHLDAEALTSADQQRDAALYRIAIIGEVASQLPAEIQTLAPEIPWAQVRDMRNHIILGYWQIDFGIVAETIAFDLAPIKETASRLIELVKRSDR
jgi:uncharacterized protein with HEPN domain